MEKFNKYLSFYQKADSGGTRTQDLEPARNPKSGGDFLLWSYDELFDSDFTRSDWYYTTNSLR
jgi:hypothetical protein